MLNDENAMLWLSSIKNINPRRKHTLLEKFGSAAELALSDRNTLIKMGFSEEIATAVFETDPERLVTEMLGMLYKKEIDFISCNSKDYPQRLKDICDYPTGIFKIGTLPDMTERRVLGMVGSRRCTAYGATATYEIAKKLAQKGAVIVSGMADGIDSLAHKGALDANGDTVAVLGCSVDICYPAANRELMEKIKEKGCVISELPPVTHPSKYTFPARNRIISGLSHVLAVMEADEKSGTLITVDHANDQGRDIMALPGNITSRLSRGTNRLISEGATIITSAEDIIRTLNIEESDENERISEKNNISLAPEEKLVYDCIHSEPITADEIILQIDMSVRDVQYALTLLELKGLITKLSGQKYITRG